MAGDYSTPPRYPPGNPPPVQPALTRGGPPIDLHKRRPDVSQPKGAVQLMLRFTRQKFLHAVAYSATATANANASPTSASSAPNTQTPPTWAWSGPTGSAAAWASAAASGSLPTIDSDGFTINIPNGVNLHVPPGNTPIISNEVSVLKTAAGGLGQIATKQSPLHRNADNQPEGIELAVITKGWHPDQFVQSQAADGSYYGQHFTVQTFKIMNGKWIHTAGWHVYGNGSVWQQAPHDFPRHVGGPPPKPP